MFEQLGELKVRWRNDADGQRLKARRAKGGARKIKRSLSWRLTGPLRYLSVWLRPSRRTKRTGEAGFLAMRGECVSRSSPTQKAIGPQRSNPRTWPVR